MSTSPSWFDQEKFSRLVKKVGTRPLPEAPPGQHGAEQGSIPGEGMAPTSRISLVSKPPSLLAEHRALPALPRRTAPMPSLKKLFPSPALSRPPSSGRPSPETHPVGEEIKDETGDAPHDPDPGQEEDALAEVWHKMGN